MKFPHAGSDIHLLQLTDCHLHQNPSHRLLGVNTQESLEQVVAAVTATPDQPDVMVATGDLVHDGSPEGYSRLAGILNRLDCRRAALPGNHDNPATMNAILPTQGIQVGGAMTIGNWCLVFLDSHYNGDSKGYLHHAELERLDALLEKESRHLLLFVHHHPLAVGTPWLDRIGLVNGGVLLELARNNSKVKGIVWGHIHHAWEGRLDHLQLFGTPSTCVQFTPGTKKFELAMEPPGWRRLVLHPDGAITSEVKQLQTVPMGLVANATGY